MSTRRLVVRLVVGMLLFFCTVVWVASYGLAVEYTFRPTAGRWCQTGVNYGTVYFATWSWSLSHPNHRLLVYDARNEGVSLGGLGIYASLSGRTPGGYGNVAILGLPLWLPLAITGIVAWLGWRSRRAAMIAARSGQCRVCGYDLRATPVRCPECGTWAGRGRAAVV